MIFAKYAAPGMCNPDDPEPCTSGTPTQAQIDNDHRSLAQRQHDALIAVGRIALMSGQLGQLNGLPVSIIIRTTLQDLESRAGVGVTGGGTIMPITDVIRLAAHANHYLAVFDKATGSALDLFRAKRVASPAQRIMLIGRDGGCTKPCCTVGAYGSQVHHAAPGLGRRRQHQRRRTRPGLRTRQPHGRATVAGPPASTPAARSNGPHPHSWTPAKPGSTTTTDPNDSCTHPTNPNPPTTQANPTAEPIGDGGCGEPEPFDLVGNDDADQPDEPDRDRRRHGESPPPEPIGDGGCGEPQPFDPVGNDRRRSARRTRAARRPSGLRVAACPA